MGLPSSFSNLMVSSLMLPTPPPMPPCWWTGDGAWDSASCIVFAFCQKTPRTDGVRCSCDKPFLGQTRPPLVNSTRETRACGFVWHVLTAVTRLASVEQHRPRSEADWIGHQNDELPRGQPTYAAERQPRADHDEAEEQRVDLHEVMSEPQHGWICACVNVHHFDIQSWLP